MRSGLVSFALVLVGCGAAASVGGTGREERVDGFGPEASARIDAAIARHGRDAAGYDASRPPVAVLDWDNTTMRGDIGDLSFALALERGLLRVPTNRDWSALEPLTDAAIAAAETACRSIAPGDVIGSETQCGRFVAHVALLGRTPAGEAAFVTPLSPTSRASYAFLAQLFAGLGPLEVGAIGREAFAAANERPLGASLSPGGVEIEAFARIQPPVRDLVGRLTEAGFSVWIVSASHEAIVRAISDEAGVPPERVIGMRPAMADGLYVHGWLDPTSETDEPAVLPPGAPPVIDFHEGKRAWIQRVIFGLRGPSVLEGHPTLRPVLALGDADTDLAMLESASELAILFDRHHVRVTCRALASPERFVVHPLFVAPPPPRTDAYPCSTYTDALGPILGEDGAPMPDRAPP